MCLARSDYTPRPAGGSQDAGVRSNTATAGSSRLPSQTRPPCSRTPVTRWKPDASSVQSCTVRAGVVEGHHPGGAPRPRLQRLRQPPREPAYRLRGPHQPLEHRVGRGRDRHPDQAVAAERDVVRVAGQVADQVVDLPGPGAGEPPAYDGPPGRLGDGDVGLVGRQCDAVREPQPVEDHLDGAVRGAPQQPAGPGVLDQVGLPPVDAVHPGGVGEPDVAAAVHGGVVAERHRLPVHQRGQLLDPAVRRVEGEQPPARVAHEQPTVGQQLEAERTSPGVPHAVDAAAVRSHPEHRAVLGAGEHPSLVVHHHVLGAVAGNGDDGERRAGRCGHRRRYPADPTSSA